MKKTSIILAMLLVAATAFSQTLMRPANPRETAGNRSKEAISTGSASSVSSSARPSQPATERQSVQHNENDSRNHTSGYSNDASPRQTPVTSGDRQGNDRETVTHSRPDYTPEPSQGPSQREIPVISNDRQGNDFENVSRPGTVNTPAQRQRPNGVTHNVPARNDGAIYQGNTRPSDKKVYGSPRQSTGPREVVHHYSRPPHSREYRSHYYPYRKPFHVSIIWTPEMQIEYSMIYPMVSYWDYPTGYMIETISAYDAIFYSGEVVNVYGQVYEVYYSMPTDEYILYFGAYYPYHDFTVVIPGNIARRFSRWPERYFKYENVMVTGLVTIFNGIPEIYVKRTYQIDIY